MNKARKNKRNGMSILAELEKTLNTAALDKGCTITIKLREITAGIKQQYTADIVIDALAQTDEFDQNRQE